jgi:hypothetical protein
MPSLLTRTAAVLALTASAALAQTQRVLDQTNSHDWVLGATVNVRAYGRTDVHTNMPTRNSFDFTSAAVVFPMIEGCASSMTKPPPDLQGKLKLNDRVSDPGPGILLSGDYPCGTRLGKWVIASDWKGEEVSLEVTIPATCYQTVYHEDRAEALGWPSSWPAVAQSTFAPQYFVDTMPGKDGEEAASDMAQIKKLIDQWMAGKDLKSMPPAKLAKFLTGKVLELVQVSGDGLNYARTGEVEGFNLQGAAETVKRGRGSAFDEVCVLAAVFRQAGIPCRTVIGWDVGEDKRDNHKFLSKNNGTKGLRGWVEFALPDPASPNGTAWVPVDVVRMRKSSSRSQAMDKPWPYFGTNDELDGVVPIAFQFHPPTKGVVAHGSPALWGWLVTPKPPDQVTQAVRFEAITQSKTADQQNKDREEQKKKDKRHGRY